MAQSNVEIYLGALEAFNRRDKEAWLATSDPELENHPPREWPEARVLRGPEEVWDFFVQGFEPWEETDLKSVGPIEEGDDTLVVNVQAEIRGKSSGAELLWNYFQVIELRDGKAVRMAWFTDRDEALKDAGITG